MLDILLVLAFNKSVLIERAVIMLHVLYHSHTKQLLLLQTTLTSLPV